MTTRIIAGTAALAATAGLALTGSAGAKAGDRTFAQTYPRASQLCANLAAGKGPRRLRPHAAEIAGDCSTLQSSFNSAHDAVVAAQSSFTAQLDADRAQIKSACTPPVADKQQCRRTRRAERAAIRALRREHRAAVRLYFRTVEAARKQFWAEIRAFPGGKQIPADQPVSQQQS